ncbi:helicase-associated domain-containing protein [Kitasatospora sp. NBC_01287]|uniref:helicase-associated domain-containing protein n=1 Tax=Kitasatospora sp. NBC_01287 TaxID=2903573 RepID=UPI002256E813|nr:helicase-associated domain-containing protein [Kitasatospora sp. NBC_01287]MCX4747973.1 helicase-associated domain-containing protein [Kitasatospora sp. NBC_01287]
MPEPARLTELAERLARPAAVGAVLRRLPLPCLQAAEALVALGGPAPRSELARLLDAREGERAAGLDTALLALSGQALVWPDAHDRLACVPALRQVWPDALGLEPPVTELLAEATGDELRSILALLRLRVPATKQQRLTLLAERFAEPGWLTAVLAGAPPGVGELLAQGARSGVVRQALVGAASGEAGRAARWARERGLLVRSHHGYGSARMPAEVTLALRGPGWHAPFDPAPPEPDLVRVGPPEVEREAVAAATTFASQAASVLAECVARPPALLKSGGVGPRELGRLGRQTQCPEPVVRLVLESAAAAGLLTGAADPGPSRASRPNGRGGPRRTVAPSKHPATDPESGGGQLLVTAAYDTWVRRDPARQLVELALAWWTLPFTPTAAQDREGKAWPALISRPPSQSCRHARRGVLTAAARLPAGRGAARASGLGRLAAWHRPLADQLPQDGTPFATVIRETELLGLVARGTLSPLGAALAEQCAERPTALLDCAARLLPAATGRALLGTDLTAVVTGPPTGPLAALLDAAADREAHGTASIWRFSPASVRRALDAGRGPQELTAELAAISTAAGAEGRLPQPLSYLITDTARRHGRIKVTAPGCVLHGPDPGLLAELAAHRRLAALRLRLLAPTVLLSAAEPEATLTALRAEGYAPIEEAVDGTVRVERVGAERAPLVPAQRPAPRPGRTPASPAELRSLASRLLTAAVAEPWQPAVDRRTEEALADRARQLTPSAIRRLAGALEADHAITITYLTPDGERTVHTLSGLEFDPPFLYARDGREEFALARIQDVQPA